MLSAQIEVLKSPLKPYGLSQDGTEDWPLSSVSTVRSADAFERTLFWAFILGLAWCPYWYGSNALIAWGINAILFAGLAIIYEISIVVRGKPHPVAVKELWIPAALFVAVVLWIAFQNVTWTASFLHHPIWAMAAEVLERPIEGSISVNRDLTTLALVRLVTAGSVFWVAVQLCRDPSRSLNFIRAIAVITCAYSAYGLAAFASTQLDNTLSNSFVTSTFYNRSHFATYAGIGLVAACGLVLQVYRSEVTIQGGPLQFKIATFIEATQKAALPLGIAFLIFVAVLMSGSRGGILAAILGLAVLSILFAVGNFSQNKLRGPMLFGVIVVGAIVFSFGNTFFSMIQEKGLVDEHRTAVQIITLRSIFDAPFVGYGYGTFADIFPLIRDRSITVVGTWKQAHNTYLEIFQGLGLVFGFALVGCVAALAWKCFKGAITRAEGVMVPCIALSASFLVGVHAVVDFSLQIQAVALTFIAILGAGVAQSKSSRLSIGD